LIDIKDLQVELGGKPIVKDISFRVEKGQFFALIGPNGSGKSTILKTLSRTILPQKGTIRIKDRDLQDYGRKEYAKMVATLTQHNQAITGLTVTDVVSYGRLPYKSLFRFLSHQDSQIIEKAIKSVDLECYKNRYVSEMSGGEVQRTFLASCFAQEPEVLFLDEPTNHLDIRHQYSILSQVRERVERESLTVLCVLHDINQALKFADGVAILDQGRIQALGPPEDVITQEAIGRYFGIPSRVHLSGTQRYVEFHPC